MKLFVTVKPNSKKCFVRRDGNQQYTVFVHEPPLGGKANYAATRALAEHFDVASSLIRISSGVSGRRKVFIVDAEL